MRAVKLGFAGIFAVSAAVCLWLGADLLHGLPLAFAFVPFAGAVAFGAASWMGLTSNPSARKWSLIASVLMILLSLFAVTYVHPAHMAAPLWAGALLGYLGLAVFGRRTVNIAKPAAPRNSALPGDGTSALASKFAALAAAIGAVEGTAHWSTWAARHGLPLHQSPTIYLQYIAAVLLVLFIHEGGHALAGVAMRMKVVTFVVGPFRWWREDGRWLFEFRALDIVSFLGAAAVVPTQMTNFRPRKFAQVAAGPIASLVTGLLVVEAMLHAPGHLWAAEWRVVAYFATISLVVAFLNFIPFKLGSAYSDGAKLYQLRGDGLWANYHRLVAAIHATKVTELRPRDYDIATVEAAAGTIARGADELNMHLCAYAHYLDNGQLAEARTALLKAEALCKESSLEPSDQWYSEFVFAIAFLRHDAAAARRWWDRMLTRESVSKKQPRQQSRLASRCALLLSEGRIAEAAEVWKKADAWSRKLPKAGASDAQRHSIQLLGHAIRERVSSIA
jgi:hypothetical protein